MHTEDIETVNNTTKQAPVSARDLPTLEEPSKSHEPSRRNPFRKRLLRVLLVLLRDRGQPNPLLSREEELIRGWPVITAMT